MKRLLFVVCCLFSFTLCAKNKLTTVYYVDSSLAIVYSEKASINIDETMPNPIFRLIQKKQRLNKKITAAALAFPFPFGVVGLHRIYLGTKPHVPVAYIASLGGVFGVLPLIDFIVIVTNKNTSTYENNEKIFMWLK